MQPFSVHPNPISTARRRQPTPQDRYRRHLSDTTSSSQLTKRKTGNVLRIHFLSVGESRWESNPPKQAAAYTGFEDQRAHQSPFCSHMENPRPAVLIIILFSIKVNTHFKGEQNLYSLSLSRFGPAGQGEVPRARHLDIRDRRSGIFQVGFRTRTRLSPTILVIFCASK